MLSIPFGESRLKLNKKDDLDGAGQVSQQHPKSELESKPNFADSHLQLLLFLNQSRDDFNKLVSLIVKDKDSETVVRDIFLLKTLAMQLVERCERWEATAFAILNQSPK